MLCCGAGREGGSSLPRCTHVEDAMSLGMIDVLYVVIILLLGSH